MRKKIYEGYNNVWSYQLCRSLKGMGVKTKLEKKGNKIVIYRV